MERSEARSMVISRQGIVATSQTLASQAGAQVLARGGSAIDAAIAANAVLGVVEPMSNGIGGDLFALYWEAESGQLSGLNASGWAPAGIGYSVSECAGDFCHAAGRHPFRHRAGMRGWLGEAASALWRHGVGGSVPACDLLCGERISGDGDYCRYLAAVDMRERCAIDWRDVPQPGAAPARWN